MVSDYLNTVRSQLNKPDYIKSLLDAGKKIDQQDADRDARQNELFSITDDNEEAFEKLDAEFYAYPDPIGQLLETFWVAHGD